MEKNDKNLRDRKRIHRYSTNRYHWFSWLFDQMNIPKNSMILEQGCGNGLLWEMNQERISSDWELILSDISPGIVKTTQYKLSQISKPIEFQVIDASKIPFTEKSFDVVIANHMLYYMNDLEQVLKDIKRVLNLEGILYASTIGKDHFRELKALLLEFEPRIDFSPEKVSENFGLENGKEILSDYFRKVNLSIYEDSLIVPEINSIVAYVLSTEGNSGDEIRSILSGKRLKHFYHYLETKLSKHGTITISKASGMFEATGY
ncbi:MAG: class I SAM-dependent methyltransferase [Candidatus Heimdallarchaeota archaeon]